MRSQHCYCSKVLLPKVTPLSGLHCLPLALNPANLELWGDMAEL